MFSNTDNDDLFAPSASSNLASLFNKAISENTDLRYTPPRQPRNDTNKPEKSAPRPNVSVITAKVVTACKLVDEEYKELGKFGFALIGNQEIARELILYKDNKNIITKLSIGDEFKITLDDGHLRFTENNNHWEIRFVNSLDLDDFVECLKRRKITINEMKKDEDEEVAVTSIKKEDEELQQSDESIGDTRASILSRMARMGQSVLPGSSIARTSMTGSDSEIDDEQSNKRIKKSKSTPANLSPLPNKIMRSLNNIIDSQVLPIQAYNNYLQANHPPATNTANVTNQEFNMFATESRNQNSEMRISLMSISSKVDNILNEIYRLKLPSSTDRLENEFLKSKIIDLENKLTAASNEDEIIKIKRENEALTQAKNDEIRKLKDTIEELKLSKVLDEDKIREIEELQLKLRHGDKIIESLDIVKQNFGEVSAKYLELQELHNNLMEENKRLLESRKELEEKIGELETKGDRIVNPDEIKEAMNQMFQNILQDFDDKDDSVYKSIKNSLAKHMKQTTFHIIKSIDKTN